MDLPTDFSQPAVSIQQVEDRMLVEAGISLAILRLDQLHPVISGNKWFKLKYNLAKAREQGKDTILSFGGAWSNHLHALAQAGHMQGFRTIGIVRGELPQPLNPCLQDAAKVGMALHGIPRSQYKDREKPHFVDWLRSRFGDFHLVPEGGANREGALGCAEITALYDQGAFDVVSMACGTGTMLAGMASTSRLPLLGFQVLKGKGYLQRQVNSHLEEFGLQPACRWSILEDYHFGGYARTTGDLMRFLTEFEQAHGIPLEPVYSAKMLYGLHNLVKKRDFFPQNCSILAIHGGGLQGRRGYAI